MADLKPFTGELDATPGLTPMTGRMDGESSGAIRRLADTGLSLAKGVIGVPEAAVGIADLVTGGRAGKLVEQAGVRFKDAKGVLDDLYSPEQKAANQEVQDAKGFLPTLGAMTRNPSTIVNAAVESAPSMLVGGVASRGVLAAAPRIGAIGAGAIGEGITAAGQNAEQVRQEDPNGTLTGQQAAILAASGVLTGGISLGAGKVANKLGIGDVQTMLAAGKTGAVGADAVAAGANKGIIRKVAEGVATEGVLQELPQSYQEQVGQNLAQGKPWDEGAAEAGAQGMMAGGLMGGVAAPLGGNAAPTKTAPAVKAPQVGFNPNAGTHTVFPDGSIILNSDSAAGEQAVFDKRFAPQNPANPAGTAGTAGILPVDPVRAAVQQAADAGGALSAAAGVAMDSGAHQDAIDQQSQAQAQAAKAKPATENVAPLTQASQAGDANVSQGSEVPAVAPVADGRGRDNAVPGMGSVLESGNEPVGAVAAAADPAGRAPEPVLPGAGTDARAVADETPAQRDRRNQLTTELATGMANGKKLNPLQVKMRQGQLARATGAQETPSSNPATVETLGTPPVTTPLPVQQQEAVNVQDPAPRTQPEPHSQAAEDQAAAAVATPAAEPAPGVSTAGRAGVEAPGVDRLSPKKSRQLQEAHKALGNDVTRQQVQSMRDGIAREVSSGKTNNGGVLATLTTKALDERRAQLARLDADLSLFGEAATSAAGKAPTTQADIKAITAKQIPQMTNAELQQAITHYGPDHQRTAKLQAALDKRPGVKPAATSVNQIHSNPASWVLKEKATGRVVMETTDPKKVAALNTEKYVAVPIAEHLAGLDVTAPAAPANPANPSPQGTPREPQANQAQPQQARQPEAPAGAVANAGTEVAANPTKHAGLKIYPIKVKIGSEVVDKWAVQTLSNAAREKNGERQLGGDPMADTLEGAKALADGEIESEKRLETYRADMAALDERRKESDAIAQAKKDANKGKSIVERGRDARLDSPTKLHPNAGLGTGSKRESMQKAVEQERLVASVMVPDTAAKNRDQNYIDRRRNLPTGNINYPGVKEYLEAIARKKADNYEKPDYRVYMGSDNRGSYYEISKTEYDYAQSLKVDAKHDEKPVSPGVERATPAPAKKQSVAVKAAAAQQARADYFTPGNIVNSYGGQDEVLSYTPPTKEGGSWSVQVQAVEKQGGQWVRIGNPEDARWHSTQPDPSELKAGPVRRAAALPAAEVATLPATDGNLTTSSAEQRAAEELARRERERKDIAKASEAAADSFVLGGDAEQNLSGQGGMFDDPAPSAPKAEAKPAKTKSASELRAQADLQAALADLGDIFSKPFKSFITPEQEQKLLPVLTRVLDAAFRLGYAKFKDAAKFSLDQIKAALGADVADALTLDHLQGAYIAMAGGKQGTDTKRAVIDIEDKSEIEAHALIDLTAKESLENANDKADTDAKDAPNAALKLDSPGTGPLAGAPANKVSGTSQVGSVATGADTGSGTDGAGNQTADRPGGQLLGGVGSDAGAVPVPTGGKGRKRASAGKPGVSGDAGLQSGSGFIDTSGGTGGLIPVNPAPNAAPIPAPAFADFTIEDDFALGEGGPKAKFTGNIAAVKLLKQLDQEGRAATPTEQAVLARYVGWGGLAQAFDPNNQDWSKEYAELKGLMSEDDYADARVSTRYAHFTSRQVIQDGIYAALKRMGFNGGRALEGGAGVGNFIGLMPADMRSASRFTAIEREPFSAKIAKHLYPQQNIQEADFTQFIGNDDFYDVAVGNPPFAADPQVDQSGRKHLSGLSLHNYFFAKEVDMLREGGILAQVVTNSFLDAVTDTARTYIAEKTKFLGAIRLPNNAFSKNANTEVTTDLIFLQKRPESEWGGKAAKLDAKQWLGVGKMVDAQGRTVPLNQYFIDHPDMMLGKFGAYGTMYRGESPALVLNPGQDTAALLKEAVARLPGNVYTDRAITNTEAMQDALVKTLNNPTVQEGGYFEEDGKLFQRIKDIAGEARGKEVTPLTQWTEKTKLGESGFARIKALSGLRATVRGLLAAELSSDPRMEDLRKTLNTQYDAYAKDHGLINDPGTLRVFDDDPDFPLLASLEHGYTPAIGLAAAKSMGIKMVPSSASKGPIFTRRVIDSRQQVAKVETPADALAVSMAERGRLDSAYIGELLGRDPDEVLKELAGGNEPLLFSDPATGEYALRDAYLSGNVRAKLVQAKQSGMFSNIQALERVQPEDVGSHEIVARVGSPWVPESVYQDFAKMLFGDGTNASIKYVKATAGYSAYITAGSETANSNTWGVSAYKGTDILSALLNNKPIKVTWKDDAGTHTDVAATENANAKAQDMRNKFQDWLFADGERAELLGRAYNDTNNNYVTREFDGEWMTFPGKVPNEIVKFRRHQRNAIARIVQDRTALLDHVVGSGKTYTVIAAAMELRRTGLARKPMIAVPNHLVKQWAADFYKLYPGANILTATKKDFEKTNRRKFLAKIGTGDWDAVIIAHSSFGFIKPAPDFEFKFNQKQIANIVKTMNEVEAGDGDKPQKKRTIKQLEGIKERLENRIKALRDKPMDALLDFGELGVDQLFVDEAHMFKNLMFSTKMQNIAGLGDASGSQRAYDMYVKVNQIYDKNGRGQGVVFATGTPVSNSLAEMYHMMRYLMPTQMQEMGFESFDAWANTYASVEQVWMQKASGDGFKAQNRMSNFVNTPELLKVFDQVSDTVTMDDIKAAYRDENDGKEFPLPKLKGGKRTPVSLRKSAGQEAHMATVAERALALEQRKGPPQKGEDNILVIMSDARKAAMDIRLVDPTATTREPGGRIDRASQEIFARYQQYSTEKGTQIVFSDLGTPLKTAKKELVEYQALKDRIEAGAGQEVMDRAALGDEAAQSKVDDAEDAQAEMEAKGRDWLGAVQAAERGFSVYDDLKTALMEKGVPEKEIAFIHDYNTDEQKAGLFRKMNAGQIRVLVGSTPKLGAGTNVQERLVALHHLDVPWKPSDVEQREGRIIRQGNKLDTSIPGFEVEVLAYVTQDTLDMRMWQVQETKLKMINQLRTRKIGREVENAFEDLELSAGEMQAAATGNMDLLREIQVKGEIKKLEQRKRAFDAQKSDLQNRKKSVAQRLASLPERIGRSGVMAEATDKYTAELNQIASTFKVTIDGQEFTSAKEAGDQILSRVDAHVYMRRQEDGKFGGRQLDEAQVIVERLTKQTEQEAKDNPWVKRPVPLSVELNGTTYTSREKLTEAFVNIRGDKEPIAWHFKGEQLVRRSAIENAIRAAVNESVAEQTVQEVGHIGPFGVSVEGQRSKADTLEIEIVLTYGGQSVSNMVWATENTATSVIRVAENLAMSARQQHDYEKRQLEQAKKESAELAAAKDVGEWPEQGKLEEMRQKHKEVLQRLSGAGVKVTADGETLQGAMGMQEAATQDDADVVFSRPAGSFTPAAQTQATEAVEKHVNALTANWENKPRIVVAFDMRDARIPQEVRAEDLKQRSGGAEGAPKGFYYRGTAYLMSSQLQTPEDTATVLFHEVLGHAGLRGLFGPALKPILNQITVMRRQDVIAKAREYGLRGVNLTGEAIDLKTASDKEVFDAMSPTQRRTAAEEVLAEMAQTQPNIGFVKRAVAAIRNWLRANVPGFKSLALTDADIIRAYILPARGFIERGRQADAGGAPAFARKAVDDPTKGWNTSPDALRKMLGTPGYSQRPLAPVMRNVDTARKVRDSLDRLVAGFPGTAASVNDRGMLAFRMPEGRQYDYRPYVDALKDFAGQNGLTVVVRAKMAGSDGALWRSLDFTPYTAPTENTVGFYGNTISPNPVAWFWTGPDSGVTDTTPMFSRSKLASLKASAMDQIHQTLSHPGKVSLWDKTVGTMRHLAERNPAFKPVFDSAQQRIDDVSTMANDAADAAPRILPRVDSWRDLGKKPVAAADNKAIGKALFEGTLSWARDDNGKPMLVNDLKKRYADLSAEEKAQMMLASGALDAGVLKMWRGLPIAQFENLINSNFDSKMLKAGVVWSDKELKTLMGMNDLQVGLYREARAAVDRSIDMTSRASMLRMVGDKYAAMRDVVLEQPTLQDAMDLLTGTLVEDAKADPDASDLLMQQYNQVVDLATKARDLMDSGYMPLSRFGKYTLDVVDADGQRQYFSMFESQRDANLMKLKMQSVFPGAKLVQGTMSAEAFKLFQGVTPESLEMFGNMLGLESTGSEAKDKAFQAYVQLAKNNHSSLKRLIHRKGIDGYSEDVGRTLASFIYSNARQAAGALNAGTMEKAVQAIPKEQGELVDVAMGLRSYISDPQEEGQAVRGMLFAQYLGGSVASAFVNMTQPFAVTMPWLSQFGGIKKAGGQMARALKDMGTKGFKYEADLTKAMKDAEDDGTVSPQEVHQLMAQARGAGGLRSGDGTRKGEALAQVSNAWEKTKVAWGQPFALAEQFNRRSTFIAAFRIAKDQGMANPAEFARKAVLETQFLYSKANKMKWGRGTVGGTLMTFKTYSISYLELMQRTWNAGTPGSPERAAGRRAVAWAMVMLMLMSGAGGLPFMEDLEDLIDALAQMLGYNVSAKQWRKQAMTDIVGKELAEFLDQGISGLPGAPIDVSGRLGMGNLIPGTGLFQTKPNHTRDMLELAGPAGDLVGRAFSGAGRLLKGDIAGAALEVAPTAVRNAAKGVDMASSGMYKDTKGYKVLDTSLAEAAAKAIGFQPRSVAEVQEANSFMLRSKGFYTQTSSEIRAQWADALFRQDDAALDKVRGRLDDWNKNNPDQPIIIRLPDVWKRVREMGKDRTQRIADTAPKALRAQMKQEVARRRADVS